MCLGTRVCLYAYIYFEIFSMAFFRFFSRCGLTFSLSDIAARSGARRARAASGRVGRRVRHLNRTKTFSDFTRDSLDSRSAAAPGTLQSAMQSARHCTSLFPTPRGPRPPSRALVVLRSSSQLADGGSTHGPRKPCAESPPSTERTCPVMNDAAGMHRKATAPAVSAGFASLPSGVASHAASSCDGLARTASSSIGVIVIHGQTQLTRMACRPHSQASASDMCAIAALVMA